MDLINYYSLISDDEVSSQKIAETLRTKLPLLTLIKTIYTTQISYMRLQNREILVDLLSKNLRRFLSRERVEQLLSETNIKDTDETVYSKFRNVIREIQHSENSSSRSPERSPISGDKRVRKWIPRRGRESRESARQQDIFRFYNGRPKKYLDLGGGDGKITSAIGQYLHLSKEKIVCADIDSWWDNDRTEKEEITYLKISEGHRLPFNDGEFGLVTCFQSLHHMKNPDLVISELYRILEPGGYIIIREHDCDSVLIKMLIDIEHCIFETVLKDPVDSFIKNYHGDYRSKNEWSRLFYRHGLLFCHRRYNFKTTRNNPTRYYYSMYCKEFRD
ncbi:MAG: class I SAM-dependent methyltransferase [Candidatus Colwellbacteria bacterium]|nr:class I SAM-dependent methyltransferase [Candidatus Colwellbacteria bacterium]